MKKLYTNKQDLLNNKYEIINHVINLINYNDDLVKTDKQYKNIFWLNSGYDYLSAYLDGYGIIQYYNGHNDWTAFNSGEQLINSFANIFDNYVRCKYE